MNRIITSMFILGISTSGYAGELADSKTAEAKVSEPTKALCDIKGGFKPLEIASVEARIKCLESELGALQELKEKISTNEFQAGLKALSSEEKDRFEQSLLNKDDLGASFSEASDDPNHAVYSIAGWWKFSAWPRIKWFFGVKGKYR